MWSVQFSWVMVFWKDKITSEPSPKRQNATCSKPTFNTPSHTLASAVTEECILEHTENLCFSYVTSQGMAEKHSLDKVIQTTITLQHTRQKKILLCNWSTQAMAGPYPELSLLPGAGSWARLQKTNHLNNTLQSAECFWMPQSSHGALSMTET